jgi:hypothetical protein
MKTYDGIIIFGCMGAGKDALGDRLLKHLSKITEARIVKLGKPIKQMVDLIAEYDDEVDQSRREFYQNYGQDTRSTMGIDVFNNIAWADISNNPIPVPIITDGRQVNEFSYWLRKDFLTIGVLANEVDRRTRLGDRDGYLPDNRAFTHETELQACYVASQLCQARVNNPGHNTLDYLDVVAEGIVNKYFGGDDR